MILTKDWTPEGADDTIDQEFPASKLPADGKVSPDEAMRLQLVFQAKSERLVDAVAQALYHEEWRKFERDNAYTIAFLSSKGQSDRKKEADAKADPSVRIAETNLFRAKAYRKLLEDKLESCIRAHHALKAVVTYHARTWSTL
jgi:hypothetical protein